MYLPWHNMVSRDVRITVCLVFMAAMVHGSKNTDGEHTIKIVKEVDSFTHLHTSETKTETLYNNSLGTSPKKGLAKITKEGEQCLARGYCIIKNPSKAIKFFLYTNPNHAPERLYVDDNTTLANSHFRPHHKTQVIVHGYTDDYLGTVPQILKEALLKNGNYNVILVDWSSISGFPYTLAVLYSKPVGDYIARFVLFLMGNNVPSTKIHLIGHSLGAHVAGFAGKATNAIGSRVSRITGLDPANPLYFFQVFPQLRLAQGDADFVDVIHTDGNCLGVDFRVGDADFYPNGGDEQPGCHKSVGASIWGCIFPLTDTFNHHCNHRRSAEYFAESVDKDRHFYAKKKCWSIVNGVPKHCIDVQPIKGAPRMGFYASPKTQGSFYLTTHSSPPYSLN